MSTTFQRTRRVSRWGTIRRYQSIESFLCLPLGDGLHNIKHQERNVDLLIRNNKAKETLVVFHGALSPRQRTIPYLQGEGISSSANVNLVACSDPALDRGALSCGWFLGDKGFGKLKPFLAPIIDYCLKQLNTQKTIIFGGSGGGYAAINFATAFPGSTVLAMNPRLNLDNPPKSTLDQYLDICHGVNTKTPMQRVKREFLEVNLADTLNRKQEFDLLILQNRNDSRFLNNQMIPFLRDLDNLDRVWLSLFDGAPGHAPVPREEIGRIVKLIAKESLSLPSAEKYLSADFRPAMTEEWSESQKTTILE